MSVREGVPEGTVTIMFTDVVASTALGDRLGDDRGQALRRAHDRILRRQFERFGGRVVKARGDGFMVAFPSARRGVRCAAEVQRAIASQQAEGRYRELQVRIGLHTGEPVEEEGDLFGSDVNLAARIEDEAGGGQVLVSELTRLLARGSPGLRFVAVGERTLKGFAEPVPLYEVCWATVRPARPPLTPFVGRQEEVTQLRRCLEEAIHGQGSLVLVAGEPGVGKTRLLSELAIDSADRGLQVLTGHAYETEGMPPYLPFIEALNQHTRGRTREELRQDLGETAPHVAKLLPEIRQSFPDVWEPPALDPEAERYRLFEGVTDFLANVAARTPLLLFLDDLHWADDASLLLLQHLSRRLAELSLLVVGAYRHTEVDDRHPLTPVLADLTRQRLASCITLRPFEREEAAALVEAVLGKTPAARVVDALFSAAAGNPFFTEELVRNIQEHGHDLADPQAAVDDWAIPEGVRHVIGRRLARLGDEANRFLAYSSVLGRDLTLPKVAAVAGRDQDSALDLLDEALAAHVLREQGEGYTFAHPLIQETLYQGLSAPRRRQLHRRVGEALEALYGEDLQAQNLSELAHHFYQAASGDGPSTRQVTDKAIAYAVRAAERALSQVAYEEAVRLYRMALHAVELKGGPDELQRCELLIALGDAEWKAGEPEKAEQTLLEAADIARRMEAPEQFARAALGIAGYIGRGALDPARIGLLGEALTRLGQGDSPLRVRLLARLSEAHPYPFSDELEKGLALSREALDVARRLGDPATMTYALFARDEALLGHPDHLPERLAIGRESLSLAEQSGDPFMSYWAHDSLACTALWMGDIPALNDEIDGMVRITEEFREPVFQENTAGVKAMRAMLDGRFQEAERLTQETIAYAEKAYGPHAHVNLDFQALLLSELGSPRERLQEVAAAIEAHLEQDDQWACFRRCRLAFLYAELGGEPEARDAYGQLAINQFAGLPTHRSRSLCLVFLSQVCASLHDLSGAAILYDFLLPYSGLNIACGDLICCGSGAYFLGLLAATMCRYEEAQAHFEQALQFDTRMGAWPFVARTEHQYAHMLLARDGPGDREKALGLLTLALGAAKELGMERLAGRAEALLGGL
jgi:class 3 adenylate cyclase/tetratricopeptide (TPR) repeat protein